MAPVTMPQDPQAFARIVDPAERAILAQKLQRYIERGLWAQKALACLNAAQRPKPPTSTDGVQPK